MSKNIAIQAENVSKLYQLGMIGSSTIIEDVSDFWNRIRGANKQHRDSENEQENIWALQDVSFEVQQGEVFGIIGKNGAGKSTLLKILSRITQPTSGEIRIKGKIASLLEVGTGFHPELSGRQNVFLNGSILGMRKSEIKKKFDEIVDFSGVGKFIDTPVKRYSSGMYVRLAFAVAAHLEPDILIIDEVLSVGDAEFQKKCLGKMESVSKNEGRTVLFVSHNMGIVSSICSTTILLEKGRLKTIGPTDKIISNYLDPSEKILVKKIDDGMRIKGDKEIEFLECSIYNLSGVKKNFFNIGEDIKLEFLIQSNVNAGVGFWLIIRDMEGKPILCSHQIDHVKQEMSTGKFIASYETQGLSLLPGNYSIAAGVLAYPQKIFFEWIENCQSFEVIPIFKSGEKCDARIGYAMQPAVWNIEKL
jgi:lipopolysaccharide transport system ATP-binding protein